MFNFNIVKRLGCSLIFKDCNYLILYVTSKCNSECKTCFYWKNVKDNKKDELTLKEYTSISKNFKNLLYLSITGGEPFLREDLADIVSQFCLNSKVFFININTNCLLPEKIYSVTNEILRRNSNVFLKIGLSIDGVGGMHDYIRGIPGNFEKVKSVFSRLNILREKYSNLAIECITTFNQYNQDQIKEIQQYVKENFDVGHVINIIRGNAKEIFLKEISIDNYLDAINFLESFKDKNSSFYLQLLYQIRKTVYHLEKDILIQKRMLYSCMAGRYMITMDEQGYIKPCEMLEQKFPARKFIFPSLREYGYNVNNIKKSKIFKESISFIRKTKCYCTFECANLCNVICNFKMISIIMLRTLMSKR